MAGRYSKNHSNYILRKHHQLTEGGSIVERDWGTLGERHAISPNKQTVYTDGSGVFLFTDNTRSGVKKRQIKTEWSQPYTSEDITLNLDTSVNLMQLPDSDDLRDYCYYGSAVELVRTSIENIIKWFPGKLWATDRHIPISNTLYPNGVIRDIMKDNNHNYSLVICDVDKLQELGGSKLFVVRNPFQIDLVKNGGIFGKYDNILRNLPNSWHSYLVNGCDIKSYTHWLKQYDECDEDYTVISEVKIVYENTVKIINNFEYYNDYNVLDCVTFSDGEDVASENKEITVYLYGIKMGNNVIWCSTDSALTIMPKPKHIYDYFNNLEGLEKKLLTQSTFPNYNPIIKTPIEYGDLSGRYYFVNRKYQLPCYGYCPLCDENSFEVYVNNLYSIADILDEEYTDNIWRNMTHESIKNFDWTYSQEYNDGDVENNILGGTRMQELLRIYGRFFDDIKRYIDNIKLKNKVTIDGSINGATFELSDKAGLIGWEVYSTKLDDVENQTLSEDFFDDYVTKKSSRYPIVNSKISLEDAQPKWFPTINVNNVSQNDVDNLFMKLLTLEGKGIFNSKGTKHAIEKIYALFGFGENEVKFKERYYSVKPINSDTDLYFYNKHIKQKVGIVYEDLSSEYNSLTNYVESFEEGLNDNNGKQYIQIGGNYYEKTVISFKDACLYLNENKTLEKHYENELFSGVPINEIVLNGTKYIVPYFNQDLYYDGNVQFETNGGWGKLTYTDSIFSEINDKTGYLETLPYMESVPNFSSLLNINVYTIGEKRIYHVMNINDVYDYITLQDEEKKRLSNYFKLLDPNNPQNLESWANIPIDNFSDSSEYENYCYEIDEEGQPLRVLFFGTQYSDYEMVKYLETIIIDNLGNNPHSSLGNYDMGYNYYQYLQQPFYYHENNYGFSNNEYLYLLAKLIRFEVKEYDSEKIIINNKLEEEYFLPSKLLIIQHKDYNYHFFNYFNNVMVKYITQVIPSTTILVFSSFTEEPPIEDVVEQYTVTINYIDKNGNQIRKSKQNVVNANSDLDFSANINVDTCYQPLHWKYTGETETFDKYLIKDITSDISIDVVYEQQLYTVAVKIEPSDITDVTVKTEYNNVCQSEGRIIIDNQNECHDYIGLFNENNVNITNDEEYSFNITNDVTYVAKFTAKEHTITINKPTGIDYIVIIYQINGVTTEFNLYEDSKTIDVPCGNSFTLSLVDTTFYRFNEWSVIGGVYTVVDGSKIEFSSITGDYSITPNVVKTSTITVQKPDNINDNVYITYDGDKLLPYTITVDAGTEVTIVAKPTTQYNCNGWNVDDINDNPHTINTSTITLTAINNCIIKPEYTQTIYSVTTTIYDPGEYQQYEVGQGIEGERIDDYWVFEKTKSYLAGSNIQIIGNDVNSYFEGWFKEVNNNWEFLSVKNPYIIGNLSENVKIGGSFGIPTETNIDIIIQKNGVELDTDYENLSTTPISQKFNFTVTHIKPDNDNGIVRYYNDTNELYYESDWAYRETVSYRYGSFVPLCFKIQSIRPIVNSNNLPVIECKSANTDGGHDEIYTSPLRNNFNSNNWILNVNGLYEYNLQIYVDDISSPGTLPGEGFIINFINN